ncbi:MAG TPA: tetratricopeptide repeat protein [Flavobacteriales bacterium]|nr:tetratricopeptide repeat protein [Flavobacteriales bacterium]
MKTLRPELLIRLLLIVSMATATAHAGAQQWLAYEKYRMVAQQNAAEELRAIGKSWSTSQDKRENHLGLLALATAALRDDDFRAALELLDSIRAHVPIEEVAIHATAHRLTSNAFNLLGDPERALHEAEAGSKMLPDTGFMRERIGLRNVKAEALLYMGDRFNEAFTLFAQNARMADSAKFTTGKCGSENGMGLIRLNQGRFTEAWEHFNESLRLARASGSEMLMQNAVANLSITAIMDGRYELALRLCDSLLTEVGDRSPEFRASLHNEMAFIHRKLNEHALALAHFQKARSLCDGLGETMLCAKVLQHLSTEYWALGRKDEAFQQMAEALTVARRMKWGTLEAEILIELHDWYNELGRTTDALKHLQAHVALADSLNMVRYDDQLARSEALYGSEKKERRIAEQDQALALAAAEDRRKSIQRNAFIGATALLVLIALLLYRTMRNRQRLARQQKELHDKQVDQLLAQQELKSINAMLEGQENERDRMGRDLHDRLGSMLGGIKAHMAAIEDRVEQLQQDQQYQKVNRLLEQTTSELRQISHDMAAATLNRFGLEKALTDLRDTLHISGRMHVELKAFGLDQRLERSVEIALYRIVQELVSNVLKHAKASELSIGVTRAPGRLSIVVSDNGVGFDTAQQNDGMGLGNVRSRAASLGATVLVDSTPGKGTTVSVECPVVE